MTDAFISHSRKDRGFARDLHARLSKLKYDIWMDWEDIPPAESWSKEILEGIENTEAVIFIISHNSLISRACHHELSYARALNKRLIPIILEKIENEILRQIELTWANSEWQDEARDNWKHLKQWNWIPLVEPDIPVQLDFEVIIKDLDKAIQYDNDHAKKHTRYYIRSQEWQKNHEDPAFLLTGKALDEAELWLKAAEAKLPTPLVQHVDYIHKSRIYADELHALEIKREQDLIRRQKITRRYVISTISLIITAVMLGIVIAITIIALQELQISHKIDTARRHHANGLGFYTEGFFDRAESSFAQALNSLSEIATDENLASIPVYRLTQNSIDLAEWLIDLGAACAQLTEPDYECARDNFNQALVFDNQAVDAYLNLAIIEREIARELNPEEQNFEAALQLLDKAAVLVDSNDFENQMQIRRIKASILFYEGNYQETLVMLNGIIKSDFLRAHAVYSTYEIDIYYYIALSHEALNHDDEMCQAWQKYQEIMIEHPPRRRIIGDVQREEDARRQIKQAHCNEY